MTHRLPQHRAKERRHANEGNGGGWSHGGAGGSSFHQCDQEAGDLLVLPDLWGHLTYNLETSVGLAQEFVY